MSLDSLKDMHIPPPEAMNCHVTWDGGFYWLKYSSNYKGDLFLEPCGSKKQYNGSGCEGCYRNREK